MTNDPNIRAVEPIQGQVQVQLATAPKLFFEATSVYLIERRTSFILLYLVEDGSEDLPRGIELLLTPTALMQFLESGKLLLATPQVGGFKQISGDRKPPPRWNNEGHFGVTACVHSVSNDLVGTDFYLLTPRMVAEALRNPSASQTSIMAEPVITCGVDVWQFKAVVQDARKACEKKAAELGLQSTPVTVGTAGGST